MSARPPEEGTAFEVMMEEIDAQLDQEGIKVPARSFKAIALISQRYGVTIPALMSQKPGPPDLERWRRLSQNIHDWYDATYGRRMEINGSPGVTIVEIGSTLYAIEVPRIMGSFCVRLSRKFMKYGSIGFNGPVDINPIEHVLDLTEARAARMTDEEVMSTCDRFFKALEGFTIIESNFASPMIRAGAGDLRTAIANLFDRDERFAESKWASLQATEKVLKTALALEGTNFPRHHQLSELAGLLKCAAKLRLNELSARIQCSAGARYGEEAVSRAEAIDAHLASIEAIALLKEPNGPLRFKPTWQLHTVGGVMP